jgi:hypothetical protein
MNDRIKAMAIEAGARFEFLHGVHYDDFQYRKFAELLLRECWTTISPFIEDDKMVEDALDELKEHFGVKE